MPEIDDLIRDYCDVKMSGQTDGIRRIEKMIPAFLLALTPAGSMRKEVEDHLRDSFESHLDERGDRADAWQQTREHFGEMTGISRQIRAAQLQFCRHLLLRLAAVISIFICFATRIFHPESFISGDALAFLTGGSALGWVIKRERNPSMLRKFAFGGAWFGLLVGLALALSGDQAADAGYAISLMLMSTFYGLVLAAPGKKGLLPILMIVLCNAGILVPLVHLNIRPIYSQTPYLELLKVSALGCIAALVGGLAIFGCTRVFRRLAGVSMLAMMLCCCQMFSRVVRFSLFDLVVTTVLSMLGTSLCLLRIRAFQAIPDTVEN